MRLPGQWQARSAHLARTSWSCAANSAKRAESTLGSRLLCGSARSRQRRRRRALVGALVELAIARLGKCQSALAVYHQVEDLFVAPGAVIPPETRRGVGTRSDLDALIVVECQQLATGQLPGADVRGTASRMQGRPSVGWLWCPESAWPGCACRRRPALRWPRPDFDGRHGTDVLRVDLGLSDRGRFHVLVVKVSEHSDGRVATAANPAR